MNKQSVYRPQPGPEEYAGCSKLVAKVMILDDHRFTREDVELARGLLDYYWNWNVTDFLNVIAGIAHPGAYEVGEAYAALVFQRG